MQEFKPSLALVALKAIIHHANADCVVAGGAARDTFYSAGEPNDVDLWVYNYPITLIRDIAKHGVQLEHEHEYVEPIADGRIAAIVKVEEIDVIFCGHHIMDIQSVVDMFDFNINQFVLLDNYPVYLGNRDAGNDRPLQFESIRSVSSERTDYMLFKAKELGVPTDEYTKLQQDKRTDLSNFFANLDTPF